MTSQSKAFMSLVAQWVWRWIGRGIASHQTDGFRKGSSKRTTWEYLRDPESIKSIRQPRLGPLVSGSWKDKEMQVPSTKCLVASCYILNLHSETKWLSETRETSARQVWWDSLGLRASRSLGTHVLQDAVCYDRTAARLPETASWEVLSKQTTLLSLWEVPDLVTHHTSINFQSSPSIDFSTFG